MNDFEIGEEVYFFNGRAYAFKKIIIVSKHPETDGLYYYEENGKKKHINYFYMYRTIDEVINKINIEKDSLDFLKFQLLEKGRV